LDLVWILEKVVFGVGYKGNILTVGGGFFLPDFFTNENFFHGFF